MPITLPSFVAPNELIQSAWGNAVVNALAEIDGEFVEKAGDTLTGFLTFTGTSGVVLPAGAPAGTQHATPKSYVDDQDALRVAKAGDTMTGTLNMNPGASNVAIRAREAGNNPVIDFWNSAVSTRYGLIDANASRVRYVSDNDIVIQAGSNEIIRGTGAVALFGKTAANLDTSGTEIYSTSSAVVGSIRSTISAASIQNLYCRHMTSADANTEAFAEFTRTSAGTLIGAITQNGTTGVTYATTSDERLKTVLRDLDDDEVALILRMIAPVVFRFDEAPDVEHVGFLAQRLAATWPTFVDVGIVTPGRNEPGDVVEYREVVEQREVLRPVVDDDGEQVADDQGHPLYVTMVVDQVVVEEVPGTGFVPWMIDLARLTPLLVAGWQQMDRRVSLLEAG